MQTSFQITESRVDEYTQAVEKQGADRTADAIRNCATTLRMAIESYRWMEEVTSNWVDVIPTRDQATFEDYYVRINQVYEKWLAPADSLLAIAEKHNGLKAIMHSYTEFRRCVQRAKAYLGAVAVRKMQDEELLSPLDSQAFLAIMARDGGLSPAK